MLIAAFVLITPASLLIYSGQRGLLAIAFLILGVANATASVSITPLFEDSAGDGLKITKAFSVYQVTSLICTSVGMLLILPLLSLTGILGETLEIYKLSLLAATSLFMLAALPLLGVKEKEPRQDRFNLTFSETTLKLTGVSALLSFGSGIAVQNIGYYFVRKFSVEAAELGVLGFAQNILIAGATMLAPLLSFHIGLLLAVVCLQLISVPLFVITAISPSFTLAAAFFTIRSTLVNMSNPLVSTLQMSLVESDERTRISMLLTLATTATTALGALIGGRLLDIWIDAPLYVAALVYTLQTLVLYITFKRVVPEG